MIRKLLVIMTVVASINDSAEGSPSPHHHDDEYDPIIRLLKEARKQRKYERGGIIRESASAQNSQFQFPSSSGSNSGGGGGNSGSPPNPILTPGSGNGGSGNFGTIGSAISGAIPPAGGSSSNYPPILPNFPSGSQIIGQLGGSNLPRPPSYPIEQVNRGVSTILNGVRSLDLGQILRGAFVFPRNENVRSVANNVIDSIFGNARQQPAGGARL